MLQSTLYFGLLVTTANDPKRTSWELGCYLGHADSQQPSNMLAPNSDAAIKADDGGEQNCSGLSP